MPRTIWRQTDPRLLSDPQFSSESYLRACAEEHHYEILRKAYTIPLYVYPPHTYVSANGQAIPIDASPSGPSAAADDGDPRPSPTLDAQWTRPIAIRDPFTNQNRGRTLATFTRGRSSAQAIGSTNPKHPDDDGAEPSSVAAGAVPSSGASSETIIDDLRLFRWKDVIIYANAGFQAKDQITLLDQIYREWFPHRAEDKDVSDGAFWGLLIRFTPPGVLSPLPPTPGGVADRESPSQPREKEEGEKHEIGFVGIKGLWEWHAALGTRLKELEEEEIRETTGSGSSSQTSPGGGLRQSLHDVLVIIDGDWQKEGVWLVWKDAETAKAYGCNTTAGNGIGNGVEEYNTEDWPSGCVFRCSLKRAMQITVSRDPVRSRKGRSEWSEMLEEMLRDEGEDGS